MLYIYYIHRRLRIVKSVKLEVATLLILFHVNIKIVKLSLFIYEKNKKQTFLLGISCLHESIEMKVEEILMMAISSGNYTEIFLNLSSCEKCNHRTSKII